jgi:MFS transporter, PAT family, beta-lactamase induction signal transducer AmpG
MVFLGFSAGLPLILVFSTLSAWFAEVKIDRATIGALALISTMYGWKFLWAPLLDLRLPVLAQALGRRRSWMLLAQVGIILGLVLMANSGLAVGNFWPMVCFALWVAFCSASQDVSIDAYRVEAIAEDDQPIAAASYTLGYRLAMLLAGAAPLLIADALDWRSAYLAMAFCALVGPISVLMIREAPRELEPPKPLVQRVREVMVRPFIDLFVRYGVMAIAMLFFICFFRMSDSVLGTMANPFYLELGYTKTQIGEISKVYGFFMTIFGAFCGAFVFKRFGAFRALWLGGLIAALSNLSFVGMAQNGGPSIMWLMIVISSDNFGSGLAGVILVLYMTQLTNREFSAGQYALFSALPQLFGKALASFSGVIVNYLDYEGFFWYTILMGVPGLLLLAVLRRKLLAQKPSSEAQLDSASQNA